MTIAPQPSPLAALHHAALAAGQTGRPQQAARLFGAILALVPDSIEALANQANAELQAGAWAAAARLYRRALWLLPGGGPVPLSLLATNLVTAWKALGRDSDIASHAAAWLTGPAWPADEKLRLALYLIGHDRLDGPAAAAAWPLAEAVRTADPARLDALVLRWYGLHRAGRLAEASAEAEALLDGQPPAVIAAERAFSLWHGVRAHDSFFAALPAASQLLPLLPRLELVAPLATGDAPVVVIGCDDAYWQRYGARLTRSLAATNPGQALHVHLIDPSDATLAALAAQRRDGPLSLGFSLERQPPFARHAGNPQYRNTYCACIRFVRLHQLYQRYRGPLIQLDADCAFTAPLHPTLDRLADADLGLIRQSRRIGPFNEFNASFVLARHSDATARFLDRLAAYLAQFLNRGDAFWTLDQAALACVLDHLTGLGIAPRLDGFHFDRIDLEFDLPFCRFSKLP